ncbi:hypothetical protein ACN28C_15470 [Plantactinospora sp. WMMC1484]|uniref:hypothetical protein n=1 Tax=Plantactinospora sp. WMMC1484 TaxID=3404122 RepID=UPI003BF55A1D
MRSTDSEIRPSDIEIRPIRADDLAEAGELGRVAFGGAPVRRPAAPTAPARHHRLRHVRPGGPARR